MTKQRLACQKAKIKVHIKAPIISYPPPGRHFDCINIDIVGPLAPSEGNRFLLTMVDRFTRWPKAIPFKKVTTLACAEAFVATWVSRFGVPSRFSSDRDPQFISQLFFCFLYFYIYPLDSQESDGGAIHRVSNFPDLLPEMPRYCCPLVI